MSEPTDGGVRRGAALMASGTAASRMLGLLRGMVLVAAIGATGQAADAFSVANKLPERPLHAARRRRAQRDPRPAGGPRLPTRPPARSTSTGC